MVNFFVIGNHDRASFYVFRRELHSNSITAIRDAQLVTPICLVLDLATIVILSIFKTACNLIACTSEPSDNVHKYNYGALQIFRHGNQETRSAHTDKSYTLFETGYSEGR